VLLQCFDYIQSNFFGDVKWLPVHRRVGFSAAGPPPMGHRAPSPLCTSIKPTYLPPALSASHSFCHPFNPRRPFSPPSGPALTACCGTQAPCSVRQSPFLRHLSDHLGPPWLLPRSTPVQQPLLLIRSPLDPTFLASSLGFTVVSMTCLAFPVAGCPLVR
jgi:hypothetical protein